MSSWARVGAKCVCVDAMEGLEHGAVYTIARTLRPYGIISGKYRKSSLGLVLEEAINPLDWADGCFAVERFRPMITKTQEEDVALFKSLLTGAPVEVEA